MYTSTGIMPKRRGCRGGAFGHRAKKLNKVFGKEIKNAGYTSTSSFLAMYNSLDQIKSTIKPDIVKRNIADAHPNQPHLDILSIQGAVQNAGLWEDHTPPELSKVVDVLRSAPGKRIQINKGKPILYLVGKTSDRGWVHGPSRKQIDEGGSDESDSDSKETQSNSDEQPPCKRRRQTRQAGPVPGKCPGFLEWFFLKKNETLKERGGKVHGILENSWLMMLDDAPNSKLKELALQDQEALTMVCVVSDLYRFETPYEWSIPSKQCESYMNGVVQKPGTVQERQIFDLLIKRAPYFLASRQRYLDRVNSKRSSAGVS